MTYALHSRRRLLQISAAAASLALLTPRAMADLPKAYWQGRALGSEAQVLLSGLTQDEAGPLLAGLDQELARLDAVFSLYQPASELSRLNQNGFLAGSSAELREVLAVAREVHDASGRGV